MVDLAQTLPSVEPSDDLLRRLGKAKSLLILDHPFFGSSVSRRPLRFTDSIATAAMSATGQIFINPEWAEPLTVRNLMFLLAHEACHYMFNHSFRLGTRDADAWNVACDKVINDLLTDAKVGDFIEGGVEFLDARLYSAEDLYDENDKGNGGIGNDIGSPTDDGGHSLDDSQKHQIAAQAKIEAIQAAKAAKAMGKLPGGVERIIQEMVNVTVPWHEKLERYMQSKIRDGYSWNRPSRRFVGQNVYLPGVDYVPKMGDLVIARDTSGSISEREDAYFNAHINRILHTCMPDNVFVVYCDTVVRRVESYTPDDLPVTLKSIGGGGTSFKPVFDWLSTRANVECLVYLTDGYGDQNKLDKPDTDVVWLSTGSDEFPFGEVISFDPSENK